MDAAVVYWANDNLYKLLEIHFIKQRLSEHDTAYQAIFFDK